jgi:ATP-dependent RNA helicase SUPV3L1/SUV3
VAQNELPELTDFDVIRKFLDVERKTIIRVNELKGDDVDYVRSKEDALIIANFLESLQKNLHNLFEQFPSLMGSFSREYISFTEFVQRDNVLDLVFLDDCLFPEKELFLFGQDGAISKSVLDIHLGVFNKWIEEKAENHKATQSLIKENFSLELKTDALRCPCVQCSGDFRTKLREHVLELCKSEINSAAESLAVEIEKVSIDEVSRLFTDMQKSVDKILLKVRYRLKRSTINRLESQIKPLIKDTFTYPSELALKRETTLKSFLLNLLYEEGIKEEIVGEDELKRFFNQLGSNLWRNQSYLQREFNKLIKSVMLLKRKDISGKILQEYIGEFWIHAQARTIKRKVIYHMGPTNSGKTYHSIEALVKAPRGCYLAPLRLLAAELYDTMNTKGVVTTLLTGEEVIEKEGATHYSSTIEMARLTERFDCCVIDEIQMITDSQRGWAWTRAFVNIFADEIHLCGDPSVLDLIKKIVELCGDELEIRKYDRMTELKVEPNQIVLGDLQKNDALIVFSRRNALRYKRDLERGGFKVSIVYGRLSPEVRREQARKFDEGETDIIVATDAISMGMNLPIRRIVFTTLVKHFNSQEHPISESEIKQIAGRAGRFKRFPTGYVNCLTKVDQGTEQVLDAIKSNLDQQKQCMVGPDLDIFSQVNGALEDNGLASLSLSEFLRLFNTMTFQKPFYCVELKEMIDLAETVEDADTEGILSQSEIFGFACAPVNLGLVEHMQYYIWILNHYVQANPIKNESIDFQSNDIDYLETSIKCVELYQWLSRHFNNKNFVFEEGDLLENKGEAIEKLNTLLSNKIVPTCSSCGVRMPESSKFNICEKCFKERRFGRRGGGPRRYTKGKPSEGDSKKSSNDTSARGGKKKSASFKKRKRKRGKPQK